MRVFVDTNLWVYRLDHRQPDKTRFVTQWLRQLVQSHDIIISTQVMIELRSVLSHKLKPAFSAKDTGTALKALAAFEVVPTHPNMVLDAHELACAEKLSWFDALIAEAALRSQCSILFSEDFNQGQLLGGKLRVQNPLHEAEVGR